MIINGDKPRWKAKNLIMDGPVYTPKEWAAHYAPPDVEVYNTI